MATLATLSNRYLDAARTNDAAISRPVDEYRLRALANEDVFLYVKSIDNSRVVREADPQAAGICWRFLLTGGFSVLLLAGLLVPSTLELLAGYQAESLKTERQHLLEEKRQLDSQVAGLLSPARLEQLAQQQQFESPTPDRVVYLNPKSDSKIAMDFGAAH